MRRDGNPQNRQPHLPRLRLDRDTLVRLSETQLQGIVGGVDKAPKTVGEGQHTCRCTMAKANPLCDILNWFEGVAR